MKIDQHRVLAPEGRLPAAFGGEKGDAQVGKEKYGAMGGDGMLVLGLGWLRV